MSCRAKGCFVHAPTDLFSHFNRGEALLRPTAMRILFLFLLLPTLLRAQNTPGTLPPPAPPGPLTLDQALSTGLRQSLLVQTNGLQIEQQRA